MVQYPNITFKLDKPKYTQSGTVDKRYKQTGTISSKSIRRIIEQEVSREILKVNALRPDTSDNIKSNKSADAKAMKTARKWRTSIMGVSITSRNAFSTKNHIDANVASTDTVALQKTITNGAVNNTISFLGTFGGPWGAVTATIISTAWSLFGNRISNGIQRAGDAKRLNYKFNHYDAYKYGTFTYNNGSDEWVAEDAKKVQNRLLGKKNLV